MDVVDEIVVGESIRRVAAIVGEPVRAVMLWSLLDGRRRPASELAFVANVSPQSASVHLAKLLRAGMVAVEARGRHRYYRIARTEVGLAVEALATLMPVERKVRVPARQTPELKYARRCYDHLAGVLAIEIVEAMQRQGWVIAGEGNFEPTLLGVRSLRTLGIDVTALAAQRRPLARQCFDWSERRPHVAGGLGAALLRELLARRWLTGVRDTRALRLTMTGRGGLNELLGLSL
jgi:DNA-binding transcriptional ArsR family regulator